VREMVATMVATLVEIMVETMAETMVGPVEETMVGPVEETMVGREWQQWPKNHQHNSDAPIHLIPLAIVPHLIDIAVRCLTMVATILNSVVAITPNQNSRSNLHCT